MTSPFSIPIETYQTSATRKTPNMQVSEQPAIVLKFKFRLVFANRWRHHYGVFSSFLSIFNMIWQVTK